MVSLEPVSPLFGLSTRIPPANLEAEQALLGALLANNKAYVRVADYLRPEHFADPLHGRIYAEIERAVVAGGLADVVTLRSVFENEVLETHERLPTGEIRTKSILAPYYLTQLLTSMVGIINAAEYGRLIHDCWIRRELIDAGETLVNQSFSQTYNAGAHESEPAVEIASRVAGQLLDLADPKASQAVVSVGDAVAEALHQLERQLMGEKPRSVPLGLAKLDRMTGGFRSPQFIVVGGRPAMGKTVLAQIAALAAARHRYDEEPAGTVLMHSMEMGADELGERFIANEARVDGTKIRDARLTQPEIDDCVAASRVIRELPIVIDDRPGLTLDQVRMRARSIAAKHKLALIVIDYLQLMAVPPDVAKHGPVAATTYLSTGLKRLAKELRVPVLALSQLSRDLERREDKRPMLADLRQSGSIEQDADVVLFMYRDAYYLEKAEPKLKPDETQDDFDARHLAWRASLDRVRDRLEIIVAKQRRGPTGTAHLRCDLATSRIWQEGDGDE